MRRRDLHLTVEPTRYKRCVHVLHGLDQRVRLELVIVCGQVLVPYANGYDGSGGNEGDDAGGEPLVGGGHVGADVGYVGVLDGDDEVDPGVGKGLEDVWVGVVDLDLVDESGLEELGYFLG